METVLIVLLLLFVLGGGGWGYSRWRGYGGFTIGVSSEITLNGAFLQEKPHLAEAG